MQLALWTHLWAAALATVPPTPTTSGPSSTLPLPDPGDLSAEIIHGERAGLDLYPATGGMLFSGTVTAPGLFGGPTTTTSLKQFACSSTLIAPDVVLLAAHCVDPAVISQGGSVEDFTLRWSRQVDLDEPNTPGDPWPADAIEVVGTAIHDDWNLIALQDFSVGDPKYDIALMFLAEPVLDVDPAVLVTPEEAEQIETGMVVDIVGWGLTEPISLLDSFTPPDGDTVGRKMWGTTSLGVVGDYEIQVGEAPEAARKCRGDSGGPTFTEVDALTATTIRLIGVTSRSADFTLCAEQGGYDTRVDAYLDWIDEAMRDACKDGTRVWCEEDRGILPPAPMEEEKRGGCDTGQRALGWWGLLALGLLRRRR